jgi:hypothetical protein
MEAVRTATSVIRENMRVLCVTCGRDLIDIREWMPTRYGVIPHAETSTMTWFERQSR